MLTVNGSVLEEERSLSTPEWSPDSQRIAYAGRVADKPALMVRRSDGTHAKRLYLPLLFTNTPVPLTGKRFAWSPDSKRLAFVCGTPGPQSEKASGDPVVITRYLYKPDLEEGKDRFNDNQRCIFS